MHRQEMYKLVIHRIVVRQARRIARYQVYPVLDWLLLLQMVRHYIALFITK
jgi:hypothetical protein